MLGNSALPFKDAFFNTFIAYNWDASGPTSFLTRNTWKKQAEFRRASERDGNLWANHLTLPKEPWPRTLSNSNWDGSAFSQPSFTWCVIGISLYVPSSYTNIGVRGCRNDEPPERSGTYTVWERLSLFHGLVHDLMSIDLQPDQQVLNEKTSTANYFTRRIPHCFSSNRTKSTAAARPHVWWKVWKNEKSMSHGQKAALSRFQLQLCLPSNPYFNNDQLSPCTSPHNQHSKQTKKHICERLQSALILLVQIYLIQARFTFF